MYMIHDNLIEAVEIFKKHKFGSKSPAAQVRAKVNADRFKQSISTLPSDLQTILKNLWLNEYYIHDERYKPQAKELRAKRKQIMSFIDEQIATIVYP